MPTDRVEVTGMAWTTALGDGLEPVWQRFWQAKRAWRRCLIPARFGTLWRPWLHPLATIFHPASPQKMATATIQRALAESGADVAQPGTFFSIGHELWNLS